VQQRLWSAETCRHFPFLGAAHDVDRPGRYAPIAVVAQTTGIPPDAMRIPAVYATAATRRRLRARVALGSM
jgi:hypothetical protein